MKNPKYQNKVFLYTDQCAICGSVFPTQEAALRGLFDINGKELVVKQITLFSGWEAEARKLEKKLGAEVPFFWDYDTDTSLSWGDVYKKTGNRFCPVKLDKEILDTFLGGEWTRKQNERG